MPFCTECGGQVADSANFCTHCGKASGGTAAAPAVSLSISKESRINQEWNALSPADWGSKKHADERGMLEGLLDDSESLAALVSGNFGPEKAVSNNTHLGIATDRRLVFLHKGRRSDDIKEIPYRDIAAIDYNAGVVMGRITVSSQSEGRFRVQNIVPKEQSKVFAETVQPLIAGTQSEMPVVVGKEERIDQEWSSLIPKGWGTFTDANMHSGERRMLHNLLESDEHLECLIGGKFGPDLGKAEFNKNTLHEGVGVATDRRVIFLDKGIFATEVAEIPYTSVEAITYSTGLMYGGLKISARGTTSLQVEMVKPKDSAKVFADSVRKHLNAGQTAAAPTVVQTASAMDELEKAAALYERGLLTPEEFDAKKAQLLNS